ncbi:hypothetical protein N7454_007369, partial [Penicillium verhagenii]
HARPQQPSTTPINLQNDQEGVPPIRILCISDTHDATPILPPGDILIHAGDLTTHGTFAEMQAQLKWLSGVKFLTSAGDSATERKQLDWSGVEYLQDEAITLELPVPGLVTQQVRRVKIYGFPLTPEFGLWAFQYPPTRHVWTGRIPDDTDILVVHGPPALYGDNDSEKKPTGQVKVKGDGYLLKIAIGRNIDGRRESHIVNAAVAPGVDHREEKSAIVIDF